MFTTPQAYFLSYTVQIILKYVMARCLEVTHCEHSLCTVYLFHFSALHMHNKYCIVLCIYTQSRRRVYISISVKHLLHFMPQQAVLFWLYTCISIKRANHYVQLILIIYCLRPEIEQRSTSIPYFSFPSNCKAMGSTIYIHPGTSWNKFIVSSLNIVCILLLKKERGCEYFDSSTGDK